MDALKSEKLCLAGDGQCDSPGHTAKYCCYSLMDLTSGYLLSTQLIDKRETNLNSNTMELCGLLRGLGDLLPKVHIDKLVTDQHCQIRKFFLVS